MQFSTLISLAFVAIVTPVLADTTDCIPNDGSCASTVEDCITDSSLWPEGTETGNDCGPLGYNTCTGLCMAGEISKN